MRALSFLTIALLTITTLAQMARAQSAPTTPYIGGNISLAKRFGFGLELGVRSPYLFIGGEYGLYNLSIGKQNTDPNDSDVNQNYVGFHAGAVIDSLYGIGLVFLWNDGRPYSFNIGPDVHLFIFKFWSLDFALTLARGLKVGAAYQFE